MIAATTTQMPLAPPEPSPQRESGTERFMRIKALINDMNEQEAKEYYDLQMKELDQGFQRQDQ